MNGTGKISSKSVSIILPFFVVHIDNAVFL